MKFNAHKWIKDYKFNKLNEMELDRTGNPIKGFTPGDMYRNDFDYVGMLKFSAEMKIPEDLSQLSDPSFIQLVKYIKKGLFFYIGSKGSSFNYIYYKNIIDVIILCFNNQSAYNKCFNISDHIRLEKAVSIISTFFKKKIHI